LRVDVARADHWIAQGAQISDRVKKLLKDARKAEVAA
jgi:small subunit ribosomal protein S16